MKKHFLLSSFLLAGLVLFAGCNESKAVSFACGDNVLVVDGQGESAEFTVNGKKVDLNQDGDSYWENSDWAVEFDKDSSRYSLLNKSNGNRIWNTCNFNNLTADCENVIEDMNLKCLNMNVSVKVCDDRAVLNMGATQHVLPKDSEFFPEAKYSFLSGDMKTGFVIKDAGVGDILPEAEYVIKLNGNDYTGCTK